MDQKLLGVNGRFLAGMALALSICLSFVLAPVEVSWAQNSGKTAVMQGKKLGEVLRPDGTLDLKSGYRGALDPAGYRIVSAPGEPPRFAVGASAPGDERWSDEFGLNGVGPDASLFALAVDGSGNLYVGGYFHVAGNVAVNNIAKWDGVEWSALGDGADSGVCALALDANGILYAGGSFTHAGGVPVEHIAKWDGSIWSSVGNFQGNYIYGLAADASGNVYAASWSSSSYQTRIDKWNGSGWYFLGPELKGFIQALAVDRNGTLYAAGRFTEVNYLVEWSGTGWTPVGGGMDSYVDALAFDARGNLYAGGKFTHAGGVAANHIAKWNGTAWSPLGDGLPEEAFSLAFDSSGNLYASGFRDLYEWRDRFYFAVWNGNAWTSLESGADNIVGSLVADGNGNVYADGRFDAGSNVAAWRAGAWSPLGHGKGLDLDTSHNVSSLALDGNGGIYAGYTVSGKGVVAKWDGTAWITIGEGWGPLTGGGGGGTGPDTWGVFYALALDTSGDLYAGGYFTSLNDQPITGIAKWDGNAWSALGDGVDETVNAIVLDDSGSLYAGGSFTTAGETQANCIAKWDGSAWSALGTGMSGGLSSAGTYVRALALDGNGNLFAGGDFTTAGGVSANRIAKWDGSAWLPLGSGLAGTVGALAVDGSGNLYAASVTTVGETQVYGIARWDGNAWSALGGAMNGSVYALAADDSGNLYAGGRFTTAGEVSANYIAKWDGSDWPPLGSGLNMFVNNNMAMVYALAFDESGNLYVGGKFTSAGGKISTFIAEWRALSISGIVQDNSGNPLSGVTVRLSGAAAKTAFTGADGGYRFTGLGHGVYTVTPGKNLYTFTPGSRSLNVNGGDLGGQDFAAARQTGQPAVTIIASSPNATEGGAKGAFKVSRSWSTNAPLTVKYTVGGTAASGTDYNALPGEVVIAANTLSAIIQVNPIDDSELEGDETVTATLSADPNYTVGSPSSATVKIADNDSVVTITATAPNASERNSGVAGNFRVRRVGPITSALSVKYAVGGTAINGTDYKNLPGVITIPAGASYVSIKVTPVDDLVAEEVETVIATLVADPHYAVGSPNSATVTIADDDSVVTITATAPNATEWGTNGYFQVSRTGPTSLPLTVWYHMSGTATNGSDYQKLPSSVIIPAGASSAAIAVIPREDSTVEGIETVTATIVGVATYIVGSPTSATVYIADNDAVVTIIAAVPNATESGTVGYFQVRRTGPSSASLAFPLSVNYTVGGTATNGADYQALSGSVTIPAGSTHVDIPVIPVADSVVDGMQTVTATISADPNYTVGSPDSATVNIADIDAVVTITASATNATEWGTKGYFRVARTGSTSFGLSVKYTLSGTATNGVDYQNLSGSVTIPVGAASANIAVTPVNDSDAEGLETVTATLSADPHYIVGSPDSATVNIVDNDAVVTITALTPNATESGTKGYFQVSRTGPTTTGLVVKYTVGGTATNGVDYQQLSGSVIIYAGRSGNLIEVIPVNDTVHEGMETVVATLSANPYYIVGSPDSATVEIADND